MLNRLRNWWRRLMRGGAAPGPTPVTPTGGGAVEKTGSGASTPTPPPTGNTRPKPKPQPSLGLGRWRRSKAEHEPGEPLADGGQGKVHVLRGDPTRAVKTFHKPLAVSAEQFAELVRLGRDLDERLRGAHVEFVWPQEPVFAGGLMTGYVMPVIPAEYRVRIRGKEYESRLEFAVPRPSKFIPDRVPTEGERRALVVAFGEFLQALHDLDHVYGDLSWYNVIYRLDPSPTVMVLDVDSIGRVGRGSLLGLPRARTRDWHEPHGVELGFDADRHQFALLVARMLLTEKLDAALDPEAPFPEALRGAGVSEQRLRALLRRAAGDNGSRPTVREWLDTLAPPAPAGIFAGLAR